MWSTVLRVAALLMLSTSALCADVWKVSSKSASHSGHAFIGGTFHLLTPADYPLPDEYDIAYSASHIVVLETDLERLQDPAFQPALARAVSFEPGKNITQVLKPATLKQLNAYLSSRNLALKDLASLKPGMFSMTLSVLELQRLGLTGGGVDEHFHQRATQDQKPLQWFETAEQQLDMIASMGKGFEDDLIVSTLRDLENVQAMMADMKKAWREGDSERLEAVALKPSLKEYPQLMESMLFARNNQWLPVIERMIANPDTEFVLVGALHLVGDRGLLAQLQKRGYQVEKVSSAPSKNSTP
jgi:uncharacterized protein YbaP (TraB family)